METKGSTRFKPRMMDLYLMPDVRASKTNPDGSLVLYGVLSKNLRDNRFEQHLYIYDISHDVHNRLSQFDYAFNTSWLSNDTIAFLAEDKNNELQIFIYNKLIGDAQQITFHPGGVNSYQPFHDGFVFITRNPDLNQNKKFGNFIHFEEEPSKSALYYTSITKALEYKQNLDQSMPNDSNQPQVPVIEISKLLKKQLAIKIIKTHTKTNSILIQCQSKDDLQFELERFYFKIDIDPNVALDAFLSSNNSFDINNFGAITELLLPKGSTIRDFSPDGQKLLISYPERDVKQYTQNDLWILDLDKAKDHFGKSDLKDFIKCITKDFDFEPLCVSWSKQGIIVSHWDESTGKFVLISENGKIIPLDMQGLSYDNSWFTINDAGYLTFEGGSSNKISDSYMAQINNGNVVSITNITNQSTKYNNWDFGSVESIRWKSKDGTEIEGVLRKPSNFNPKKKYPLIFHIHGGPAASSPNILLSSNDRNYYPTIQFSHEEILILMPNYRNSLGRGQWFTELGVDNLGIGEMWDIESAIDYLSQQGFVDETKIGAMGWSQGGFISAFLGMHSSRFKAVSCGASVSSWYTYYISSDIRHSLNISGNPTEPGMLEIYSKTAPISGLSNAKTPMLLQHGENDARISVVSAHELHRSLKDKGIQTDLFIYPNMGHGFNNPREVYAAMIQNYRWFMHHFYGHELDYLKDDAEV